MAVHPFDAAGASVVERGDTQDGAYVAEAVDALGVKSLASWHPYENATRRQWQVDGVAALHPDSGNLEIIVHFMVEDLSANTSPFSRYGTAGNISWGFWIDTSGRINFRWSDNGSSVTTLAWASGGALPLSAGDELYTKIVLVPDNGAGGSDLNRYESSDGGVTWTETNDDTLTQRTPLYDPTTGSDLIVGGWDQAATPSNPWRGWVKFAQINDGADGDPIFTFDPARDAYRGATSWVDADSGLTVSLQSVSSQSDWPTLDGLQLGLDGADFALTSYEPSFTATTGALTVYAVITPGAGSTNFARVLSVESANNDGAYISRFTADTTYGAVAGGASTVVTTSTTGFANGTRVGVAIVIDNGTVAFYCSHNGLGSSSSITSVGTITINPLVVGANAFNDGNTWVGDIQSGTPIAIERALTEAELQQLDAHFGL